MGIIKAKQPTRVKETIWPFDMIETTTYAAPFPFPPFPQYAAKTLPNPPVNRPVGPFAGMFEVFKPTPKGFVYIRDDLFKTVTVAPLGLVADRIPEFPDTLFPGITRAPIESVSEKIKSPASFRDINDLGLVRMQLQPFVFDQLAHQGECAPRFIQGLAQDHEVVRIPDHSITRLGHCKINRVQIQVGEQRAYNRPLRRPPFRSPALYFIEDVRLEKGFQQFEHPPVRDTFADVFHKQVVRNAIKVGFYVRIHHVGVSGFEEPVHFPEGILASQSWPESKTCRRKLTFEDGFDYQAQRSLNHPVTHGGNAERPFVFTSWLVYVDSPHRSRTVGPRAQFLFELSEVFIQLAFEIRDALMVRSGTASIRFHTAPCGMKRFKTTDLVNQTKPNVSFHPSFEGLQHTLCPHRPFDPIPLPGTGFSRLLSRFRHCREFLFVMFGHSASIFPHPFAPRALPRIPATMGTLTPARLALRTLIGGNEHQPCSGQVSLFYTTHLSMHSVTNHPTHPVIAFKLSTQRDGLPESTLMGSPGVSGLDFTTNELARRNARPNCVRHYPTDCMFASGCSPPRLMTTQLPSATGSGHLPGGTFTPKARLLGGALTPAGLLSRGPDG